MAGGTVTISGGNVIHTFTSSGYLTPLKLVNNSLRFRSSASAYLNRTFGTPTSGSTWTMSMWVKRGKLSTSQTLFGVYNSGTNYFVAEFQSNDTFQTFDRPSGGATGQLVTTQVFRDPAAWYHIVLVWDTTQATSTNRQKLYINGVQVTSFSTQTNSSQSAVSRWNFASYNGSIGNDGNAGVYFDGYMTEINFIDGQALTPNSFGTANSYGVWQPITYGGSYGTNGFYLPFTNRTSTTTLGYDFSPQGNNWTTNNISLGPAVVQSFTSTGTTSWTAPAGVYGATYLVVAGGGSGGGYVGGGGGAGGLLTGTLAVTPGSSYTVTVGAGGTAVTSTTRGNSGGNSVFDTVTATGGGGGGARNGTTAGISGGSGGGGAFNAGAGGTGTSGQGFAGAANNGANGSASGGGGASAVGGTNATNGGTGGAGTASSISGSSVTYAGGGGGGTDAGSGGSGGAGGGGAGALSGNGTAGTANTGGGGGGAGSAGGAATSGAGGSGIVIISYSNPASSTNDSMTDVPTLTSATAANTCVINPLTPTTVSSLGSSSTLTDGNLYINFTSVAYDGFLPATMGATSGKFYYEFKLNATTVNGHMIGVLGNTSSTGGESLVAVYRWATGIVRVNASTVTTGLATCTAGDVIGVAFDATNGTCAWYKNNTLLYTATGLTYSIYTPLIYGEGGSGRTFSGWANYGQQPYFYTPPSNYLAINTYNL
jgi:hypothetical protein